MKCKSNGFASLFLLSFIPMILALFFTFQLIWAGQQLLIVPLQICRTHHLRLQDDAGKALSELLALNPQVTSLRAQKKTAEVALAAAIAAGRAEMAVQIRQQLQMIREMQARLLVAQRKLFFFQRQQSFATQLQMQNKMRENLAALQKRWGFFSEIRLSEISTPAHRLAVKPDLTSDEPSIYEPESDFSQKESSQAFWKISLQVHSKHWLFSQIQQRALWKESCGASLFKRKKSWEAKLWRQETTASEDRS